MFKVVKPLNAIEGIADAEFVGATSLSAGFDDARPNGAVGHERTWLQQAHQPLPAAGNPCAAVTSGGW
jgi:hypothetical protein